MFRFTYTFEKNNTLSRTYSVTEEKLRDLCLIKDGRTIIFWKRLPDEGCIGRKQFISFNRKKEVIQVTAYSERILIGETFEKDLGRIVEESAEENLHDFRDTMISFLTDEGGDMYKIGIKIEEIK